MLRLRSGETKKQLNLKSVVSQVTHYSKYSVKHLRFLTSQPCTIKSMHTETFSVRIPPPKSHRPHVGKKQNKKKNGAS